jgi:hypothetical protein
MAPLQRQMSRLNNKLQEALAVKTARQSTLDSLDATIGLAYSQVRPDAAGVVNSWAGRYGKPGALRKFVISQLMNVGATGANSRELGIAALVHFRLDIADKLELQRFLKNTFRPLLANLRKDGLAEVVPSVNRAKESLPWRLKQAPSLADLAVQAAAIAKAAADELKPSPGSRPGPTDSNPS